MPRQTFSNHVRYYPAHHFVFYPLLLAAIAASVYAYYHYPGEKHIWAAIIVLFIFTGWSSFMMRQHYALGNQNRIVRLELRFRYYILTGKRLEPLESTLRFSQLAALRFASDEELPVLIDRAVNERLTPRQIKESIQQWLPDMMRV